MVDEIAVCGEVLAKVRDNDCGFWKSFCDALAVIGFAYKINEARDIVFGGEIEYGINDIICEPNFATVDFDTGETQIGNGVFDMV